MIRAMTGAQRYIIVGLLLIIIAEAAVSFYFRQETKMSRQETATAKQETETERLNVKAAREETDLVRSELKGVRAELESARESLKLRDDELEQLNKNKEQTDASLRQALRSSTSRDWASGSIPDSVRNALKETRAEPDSSGSANSAPGGTVKGL